MALLRTKTATVVLTCSVPLATDWPCGLIMKAVPHATIAANSSNPPMNIRARPIRGSSHLSSLPADCEPPSNVRIVLGERVRETCPPVPSATK